jgi:hypothetical protein
MARGDRRLGPVILEAVKNGAKMDGWNEYFRADVWDRAFETCGVDPAYYTQRGFTDEEVLPWSSISVGVSDAFFRRERQRAYEGKITPDCRVQCSACGADKLYEGGKCDA